jgi:PAS domain S-box-containing protein
MESRFFATRCSALALVLVLTTTSFAQETRNGRRAGLSLSPAEQQWLDAHPKIRIAPDPNFAPIEWIDDDGNYQGLAADFIGLIEDKLGITFQLVALDNWNEVLALARSRDVDVLPCAAATAERREFLSFIPAHIKLPGVILSSTAHRGALTLEDLEGRTVAVVLNSYWAELLREKHPDIRLDAVLSIAEGLEKTSLGTVDAMVTDIATATHYAEKQNLENIKVAGQTGYCFRLGMAVRSDWPELVTILQEALQAIPPQKRAEIQRKWILRESQSSSHDDLFSGLAMASVVVALGVLAAFLLWNRALQSKVASRQDSTDGQLLRDWTDASLNRWKILFYAVATMSIITICVGAMATYLLYNASFEEQRQRLVETATAQARLIEAIARANREPRQASGVEKATTATIAQIVDAHQHQSGLGKTGEFALARLEGDEMVFVLERRHSVPNQSMRIPYYDSKLAEPMRRALTGRSGTIVATDYRGELVLAAYEPVGEIDLGIVAKIDLAEIRRPFGRAVIVGLGFATLLILTGGLVLVWVNTPLIKRVEGAQEALRASEERFRGYFEHSQVGMAVTAPDGEWLEANGRLRKMLGYDLDELREMTWTELTHPDDLKEDEEQYEQMLAGKIDNYTMDKRFVRKNGEVVHTNLAVSCVRDEAGAVKLALTSILDITQRKQAELFLQEARHAAEAANRAKSDFLSHMSHELRTPLNGILGYAQILQRDSGFTKRQRSNLDAIVNCGDHLLELINDVLDLSKIEAGRLEIDLQPCNLRDLIGAVGDMVGERVRSKGLSFATEVAPEIPQAIFSDAAKLRQILINLLGNAVKFTEKGSVTLRVSESPKGSLLLEVIDSGIGLNPEELDQIFDAFKQVEAGKIAGGTGLGLSITRRLTEALGGEITVQSVAGEGSLFSVRLPLSEASQDAVTAVADDESLHGQQLHLLEGETRTILVADDRDTNRDVLRSLLENAGFHVVLAVDGQDALERLRDNSSIDLVLMDVRMPRLSGIEALQRIRADNSLAMLKVIAVTASVFPEFKKEAMDAGFDDFLGKPFRADDLFDKLAKHLNVKLGKSIAFEETQLLTADCSSQATAKLSGELVAQLRQALKIKNLTAIKAVAKKAMADPKSNEIGEQIEEHAATFDFQRLAELLSELEKTCD